MSKSVIFGDEARSKLLQGVELVNKAVSKTLGPKGRNAVLSRDVAPPIITNDGASIAAFFNKIKDPYVNTGVQMIKEVSGKSNEVGDGTTTSTVLAASLVREGIKYIAAGIDPLEIKEGILNASKEVIEGLKKIAKPISTKEEFMEVATISAEDVKMGEIIGEIIHEVGKDGGVTVETTSQPKLEKEITSGIKFDQGFITPYLMTNPYRQEAVFEDVPILITDNKIKFNEDIEPICNELLKKGIKGLVIICDDMQGEALATAVNNTMKNILSFLIIRLPGLDEWRKKNALDISIATGAKFISEDMGLKVRDITFADLGRCKRIISKRDYTIIVEGSGLKEEINKQIKFVKEELKESISDFERDQHKERIARLTGGVGVLRVGASTEQELIYKKHKIEDALSAVRAAEEQGIVSGGGASLLRLTKTSTEIGEQILYRAITEPIRIIADNAGKNADTIMEKILLQDNQNYGWDAKTNQYGDLIEKGIIDPVKVIIKAIENAVSMACVFLTTETLIVDIKEKDANESNIRRN